MALPTITATGNVAQDPQLGYGSQGTAFARFTIACNENKKNPDGTWETISTTWLRVVVFGSDAEAVAGNVAKGDKVTVMGRLVQSDYEKDGVKKTSFEVKNATILTEIRQNSDRKVTENRQNSAKTLTENSTQKNSFVAENATQNDPWTLAGSDSGAPF